MLGKQPNVRELLRRLAVEVLGSNLSTRLRLKKIEGSRPLIILNLHRVGPPVRTCLPRLAPQRFEELLRFAGRNFAILPFADIREPADRPQMVLSFDDGYHDFLEYALPLISEHQLAVNLNVVPACVESGLPPLQVLMGDFLKGAPEELIAGIDLPGFDMARKDRRAARLDQFLQSLEGGAQVRVAQYLLPQLRRWDAYQPAPMLNRAEIAKISESHEIGAHSFEHASMAYQTGAYLLEDVARCRRWTEEATGKPLRIYAFPNGSHRPDQPELVRGAGIDHVLLSGGSLNGRNGVRDRVGFVARTSAELRFRALGARAAAR